MFVVGIYFEIWWVFEKLYEDGRVWVIGVLNFELVYFEWIVIDRGIVLVVN